MKTTAKPQTDQECPICKSEQIEGSCLSVENSEARQALHCLDCDSEWTNVYSFSGTADVADYSTQGPKR